MIRTIEVETDDNFKECDDCIHDDDTIEICKMRGCIHAIEKEDIKECYQPKKYLISKSELNASVKSIEKLKKIEKIINASFYDEKEESEGK